MVLQVEPFWMSVHFNVCKWYACGFRILFSLLENQILHVQEAYIPEVQIQPLLNFIYIYYYYNTAHTQKSILSKPKPYVWKEINCPHCQYLQN